MTPRDLLDRLDAEGVSLSLKLRVEGDTQPSPETVELLEAHRATLLAYLAREHATGGVHLPGLLLHNLMLWTARHHELRITFPDGFILNAQPHHVTEAVQAHPWGVVYDPDRYLLMSWGNVPAEELQGLRELDTDRRLEVMN